VSDVHLGYEWARGAGGDSIPAHSLAETLARLSGILACAAIERLVVAGDLVESTRACRRTDAEVADFTSWLAARGVTVIRLAGNHDPPCLPPLPQLLEVDGWTISHGHLPIAAGRHIVGHGHPVIRCGSVNARCFLVSARRIALPAFTANAAGCNVAGAALTLPDGWRDRTLRCIVAGDGEWFDFGPLVQLSRRLRRSRAAPGS
jgi:metallophosphoesterase superfamily enzyme